MAEIEILWMGDHSGDYGHQGHNLKCLFPNQRIRNPAIFISKSAQTGIRYLPSIDILSMSCLFMGIEMTDSSELKRRYEQIIETPKNELSYNEHGESVVILCQSEWIRILVIQFQDSANLVSIEVEFSLPARSETVSSGVRENSDLEKAEHETKKLANQVIEHLRYMTLLQDEGFSLDLIGQECLWTASRDLQESPSQEFFELLNPPSKCVPWSAESSVISPFRYLL